MVRLFLILCLVFPLQAFADERFMPYIEWLVDNSEYEYNDEPLPTVEIMPYAWLEVTVYTPEVVARSEQNGNDLPIIRGAYDHERNVMMFPDDSDWTQKEDVIVHELFHFLQYINGDVPDCLQKMERPAYDAHWQWVQAHGKTDVYEEPNWLFVYMIEMACHERYDYWNGHPPNAR